MSVINAIDDAEEVKFVYQCLSKVPKPLQMRVAKLFINKYDTSLKSTANATKDELIQISRALYDFSGTKNPHQKVQPTSANIRAQYSANNWLRRTVKTLKPRLKILEQITNAMPLPWHILANADKTKYYLDSTITDANIKIETFNVKGSEPIYDTVRYTHWGPIVDDATSLIPRSEGLF